MFSWLPEDLVEEVLRFIEPQERAGLLLVCRQWARIVRRLQTSLELYFGPTLERPVAFGVSPAAAAAGRPSWPEEPEAAAALVRSLLSCLAQRRIASFRFDWIKASEHGALLDGAAPLVGPTLGHLRLQWSGASHPPQWVWALPQLRSLDLQFVKAVPDQLTRLTGLTRLDLMVHTSDIEDPPNWDVPAGISALANLEELKVSAALSGQHIGQLSTLTTLRRLQLFEASTPHLHWLQALTQLTWFQYYAVDNAAPLPREAWDTALAPLKQLKMLDLECAMVEEVPPCVCQMTGLTGLRLRFNYELFVLPPGPYLMGLRLLDVAGSPIMVLPLPQSPPGALQQLTVLGFGDDWEELPEVLANQLRAHAARQPGRMAFPELTCIYTFAGEQECDDGIQGLMQAGVLPTVPIKDSNEYYTDDN